MSDVLIRKHNNVYVYIDADPHIIMGMSESFSRYVKGYQFMPSFKARAWDGKIRFLQYQTGLIYAGLLPAVLEYCKDERLSVTIDDEVKSMFLSNFDPSDYLSKMVLSAHGAKIELRDYQVKSIKTAIKNKRRLIQSPTSSGKSSVIYSTVRYLIDEVFDEDDCIIVVVPTINLVTQLKSDFKDYSTLNGWDVEKYVGLIGGGKREDGKQIIISTWQSIYKLPAKYFDKFRAFIVDEVHQAKAKSLTGIGQKCNAEYRLGLSGSIDAEDETTEMTLQGLFGNKFVATTTKALMDNGDVSKLKVNCVHIKHKHNHKIPKDYQKEIDWLCGNIARNEFIVDLANNVDGNTLVLFSLVQKHGKPLFEMMKKEGKETFFIYGGTDVEQREKVRHIAETHKGCIILASYQTFSTGVNIRNLHNIVFASPTKSFARVIQSIGRGLRKSATKTECNVYDLFDEIYGNMKDPKSLNYTMKHFVERAKIYTKEGFDFDVNRIDMEYRE